MNVYVALCGYDYESGYLIGVFDSQDKAEKAVNDHRTQETDVTSPSLQKDWYLVLECELNVADMEPGPI